MKGENREPMTLSVVIPTKGGVRFTAECLASLAQSAKGLAYEVIVVDNGSTDETLSFLGSHTAGQLRGKAQGETPPVRVRVLHNTQACLARSWNLGCEAAEGRFLLVSNNDVIYAPGSLQAMLAAFDTSPQVGCVLPWSPQNVRGMLPGVTPPKTPEDTVRNLEAVGAWAMRRQGAERVRLVSDGKIAQGGYAFMTPKTVWEEVGPFDERYRGYTAEDYDWFMRLLRRYKMAQVEAAYVEHHGSQTRAWDYDNNHITTMRNRFLLTEIQEGIKEVFSIIIPVYNRVESLRAAIESVRAQTYPHWRIYVIDDGSEEWDRVQGLARHYSGAGVDETGRIGFFHLRENSGPGNARNVGLDLSQGKYVAFLDSDDIWFEKHLETHLAAHEQGFAEMVYTDPAFAWRWWDERTKTFLHKVEAHPTIKYFGAFDRGRLQEYNYIQTSAVSLWGETARSLRFNDRRIEEDWDFFRSVTGPVIHVPQKTCRYHLSKNAESEHLMGRVLDISGGAVSWETRRSVVIPHALTEAARLGVVIPTFNRPDALRRAIESLEYTDCPFCVCDDGGHDAGAVARLIETYPQGSLLRLPGNQGASAARNRAAEYLPCEWIQFLDDDDLLLPGWRERLLPHLTADYDVICSAAVVPQQGGFGVTDAVMTSQVCVRREVFLRAGGFAEGVTWAEERHLLDRLKQASARVKTLALPIVFRPVRGGSGDQATRQDITGQSHAGRRLRGVF